MRYLQSVSAAFLFASGGDGYFVLFLLHQIKISIALILYHLHSKTLQLEDLPSVPKKSDLDKMTWYPIP